MRLAGKAREGRILPVCDRRATPSARMQHRSNAAGLSPRAARHLCVAKPVERRVSVHPGARTPLPSRRSSRWRIRVARWSALSQPVELARRQTELPDDLEAGRRSDLSAAMERDGDGSTVRVQPPFVTPRLSLSHEAQRRRDPLKIRGRRARSARFRSCPSGVAGRAPGALRRSDETPVPVQPGPPRAYPSTHDSRRWTECPPPKSGHPSDTPQPCL